MDPFKQALKTRSGKGVSLSIEMEKPEESKTTDRAPSVKDRAPDVEEGDQVDGDSDRLNSIIETLKGDPEKLSLVEKLISDNDAENGEDSTGMEEEMMGGMSDTDKSDLAKREKPRSLFERAQKARLQE